MNKIRKNKFLRDLYLLIKNKHTQKMYHLLSINRKYSSTNSRFHLYINKTITSYMH